MLTKRNLTYGLLIPQGLLLLHHMRGQHGHVCCGKGLLCDCRICSVLILESRKHQTQDSRRWGVTLITFPLGEMETQSLQGVECGSDLELTAWTSSQALLHLWEEVEVFSVSNSIASQKLWYWTILQNLFISISTVSIHGNYGMVMVREGSWLWQIKYG